MERGESLRDTCFIPDTALHEVASYNITQSVEKLAKNGAKVSKTEVKAMMIGIRKGTSIGVNICGGQFV